ncbi:TonB-dependent receptor [Hyphococcus flavus]|uniref:TonB-dependent receptor n=1 Tax=Hyphococcus flavus TaxID=1866326 RepID=A0AAF0CFT7_9PROT|nr:TonB-dependent receptor [Hyphococcus flavus]WDI31408.1 TonB-dependent receptor [Hyphococcus flavus]
MKLSNTLSAGVAAIALTTAFSTVVAPTPAHAQQTTSEIRGSVLLPSGAPAAGAQVMVIDTRTGATRTLTTDDNGSFAARGLPVGGPYTVTTSLSGYQSQRFENIRANLGSSTSLTFNLSSAAAGADQIIVTATRSNVSELAIGPSASFDLDTLESLPSIDRDIRDVIRLDPRVTIDENNNDSISCLGGNFRSNSFTIDGVRNADGFGLNDSGFPNRNNLPIPFDAVRETSVEFSPFDVEYGQFSGCNINVVTKAGTNEFHGGAFGVFNNGDLTGETIDGNTVRSGEFKDWNWGASLGGPIIKDRLWFFGAYEEVQDGGSTVDTGPLGAGFANELDYLPESVANDIANTLQTVYGRDAMGFARNLPDKSRRILGRVDWAINDDHRLELTYSRLRELRQDPDDLGFDADFTFFDNFENEGTNSENYSARLFSQWTDNFSTEIRVSRLDVEDIQGPVGGGEAQDGNPKPRILIENIMNNGDTGAVLSGPGFFRSANDLQTQLDQIKFKADWVTGRHTLTAGIEVDQFDVFNLFVPDATGTITFDSLADFEAGLASEITGSGSFTGDINDAAAEFRRTIYTAYVQDEIQVTDDLIATVGLRYDYYGSDDDPRFNPVFFQKYGFSNTKAFDGLDIIQPRFGVNYDAGETIFGETQFRGGVGVFSGGDPSVWFANNYQNFGGAIGSGNSGNPACNMSDLQVVSGGTFTGIPACITSQQIAEATQNGAAVNAVDPNFKLPSVLRYNVGLSHYTNFTGGGGFFDDWNVQIDFIRSELKNPTDWVNLQLTPTSEVAPDGRPIINNVNPLNAGCDATFLGIRQGFAGSDLSDSGLCDSGFTDEDILLTNAIGDGGFTQNISAAFAKRFEYNLGNSPGAFDFMVGYAYSTAEVVNPSNSSTAGSSFEEVAVVTPNQAFLAPSQFVNNHNFTMAARFSQEFIKDYPTRLNIFFNARSGNRFSYVFQDDADDFLGDSDDEARRLLYVPTGPSDPLIDTSMLSAADVDALFAFLDSSGLSEYAGQIAPRNAFKDPWFKDMDIRISQDIPGFFGSDRFQVFVDIENALNLIDDGMNVFERWDRGNVAEGVEVYELGGISGGQYIISAFEDPELQQEVNPSVWAVQFGVRYDF